MQKKHIEMKWLTIILVFMVISNSGWSRRLKTEKALALCHLCPKGDISFNCACEHDDWWNSRNDSIPKGPVHCIRNTWVCDGWKDCPDGSDEIDCYCSDDEFQCSYCTEGKSCSGDISPILFQCIPMSEVNDTKKNCLSAKDETNEYEEKCYNEAKCNGVIDCPWLSPNDEANCSCPITDPNTCACAAGDKFSCDGKGDICFRKDDISSQALERLYDEIYNIDYGYEEIEDITLPGEKCDQIYDCLDFSDELNCPCREDQFACQCYRKNPVTCSDEANPIFPGCIPKAKFHDNEIDCTDGSDETPFKRIVENCDNCTVIIRRLNTLSECIDIGFPSCDSSTCFSVPAFNCSSNDCNEFEVLCTSYCPNSTRCNRAFQCNDGSLALASEFCNGRFDCPDHSDETRDKLGFVCVEFAGSCILPQRNLYDGVSHCSDDSDLCLKDESLCFVCLDKRLKISTSQVCDGIVNCYDSSDECLCESNFENPFCNSLFPSFDSSTFECAKNEQFLADKTTYGEFQLGNFSKIETTRCRTKYEYITATMCDGRPECRDFTDECNCPNPPPFCNDNCSSFFQMGDRYCDGIVDEAWMYINKSYCPQGFDEINCPLRFNCISGNKVSINLDQVCNGKIDCDDASDEKRCSTTENVFSSEDEMINSDLLKFCFWFIGFSVIVGNSFVLITTIRFLKNKKLRKSLRYQYLIIVNISIADFIMGFYLLTIASYSAYFSGFYGQFDYEWRSSLRCSVIGSLAFFSSEASCFLMVVLTGFRLHKIYFPLRALTASAMRWRLSIIAAWVCAFGLAYTPILNKSSLYFTHGVWFSNIFTSRQVWSQSNITRFACRLAALTNTTLPGSGKAWISTSSFLTKKFPSYAPLGEFGYYGETSVCMPRFYIERGEKAWEYTLLIITLNFLSFIMIAISYALIYIRSVKIPADLKKNLSSNRESTMQRRIAMIIFSDSLCWIPICIMAFTRLGGVFVSKEAYIVSAALLLPVNSAFNPLLYSPLLDNIIAAFKKTKFLKKSVIPLAQFT